MPNSINFVFWEGRYICAYQTLEQRQVYDKGDLVAESREVGDKGRAVLVHRGVLGMMARGAAHGAVDVADEEVGAIRARS